MDISSIFGGNKGSANKAIDNQWYMYLSNWLDNAPYRTLGQSSAYMLDDYLQGGYNPNNDPNYNFMRGEVDRNMNRQLRFLGRQNSSYGIDSMARAYGNLADTYQQRRYNQLLGGVGAGQGNANAQTAASASTGNSMAQNSLSAQQMNQQQGWNNLAALLNTMNIGMQGYDWGKGQGWWGSGTTGGTESLFNSNTWA